MLKANEHIFETLAEALSEGVIVVDSSQKIVVVNSSAEDMFGYTKQELVGQSLNILIPTKYRGHHGDHFKSFFTKSEKRQMGRGRDLYGVRKNGTQLPVEVGLNPFDFNDETYVMALVVDITERKEIEKDLMTKSEALNSAINGISISDATLEDHPLIYVNPSFEAITGYPKEEVLNRNCRFLQSDDRDQDSIREMRKAIDEGKSCQAVIRNYKKDGTMFWNEVSITPVKNKQGKVTHFIGIQNDITKRKTVEQERSHFSRIFDESQNEIYIFECDSLKFVNVNCGALNNIGYTIEELKQMTPVDVKPNFTIPEFRKLLKPLLSNEVEKIRFETVHERKDKSTYPVEVHLQLSSFGNIDVFIAIILDITERKNYTEKLEKTVKIRTKELQIALANEIELNELKTQFLSLVSHEFKTPLSGILTSSTLLEKYKTTEQQDNRDRHIKTIQSKVRYLDNILNDFLSIERLDSNKVIYKPTTFRVSKVINEVIYNANMLLKDGQRINYPEDIDDFIITQDEKILELSLSNLLHNAIKYSGENTEIDIKVNLRSKPDRICFKIADQGRGIPESDQKHIFSRYFRAKNALLDHGTGIGLNIVKGHVENLGGNISFVSKENKGSKFTIELPVTN